MKTSCPRCQWSGWIPTEMMGQSIHCPECNAAFPSCPGYRHPLKTTLLCILVMLVGLFLLLAYFVLHFKDAYDFIRR